MQKKNGRNAHQKIGNAALIMALQEAFIKLNPRHQLKNPVMFVVLVCAVICSFVTLEDLLKGENFSFHLQVSLWMWATLLFANFAEAFAEGRGKAQAASLRQTRKFVQCLRKEGEHFVTVTSQDLRPGDVVFCQSGDTVPLDGEVIEGIATVDESAITGESAPVIRESGGDRSAVTGGTRVVSDSLIIRITAAPGQAFLDRMIAMVEGASRKPTPNELALGVLLVSLTGVFILAVVSLKGFALFSERSSGMAAGSTADLAILSALLVCLIPTTIGGLLSAIGISGISRLLQKNVVATSGKAVEAAGDVDVLLLDKTGTITLGNRRATQFLPVVGVAERDLAFAAWLASLADETPEGRSIVTLAEERFDCRRPENFSVDDFVPFSAQTRMSGLIKGNNVVMKGAVDAIASYAESLKLAVPKELKMLADEAARHGATPLAVISNGVVQGIVVLKDIVKKDIKERFAQLRRMGIKTVMITGDNALTAASIAAEAGVDDFIAEATPESKLRRIRDEQGKGHMVGMIGDGTNDAPALAQADVGVAMNTGTQAAREASNMVDLDSDPTKLIEIVETGKQLLMTRGALTTFSIANDVAKYFAVIPAMFVGLYAPQGNANSLGPLAALNIMHLHSPQSAILSAIIFNAIIIILLVPLAIRGVAYRPVGAEILLRRNLLIYGFGGVIMPFVGIKMIDMFISYLAMV